MAALTDIFSTPLVSGNRRGDAPLQPTSYVKDASGHEHKGKGPGGGQFTSQGGGEGGSSEPTSEPVPTKVVTKNLVQWGASQLGIPEKRLDELITSRTRPGVSRGLAFDMILKEGGVVLPTRAPSKSPKAKAKSPPKPESTAQETERALSQEPPTNVKRIYSPTSVVQLLTFPNGLEGVFKPASGELQEVRTEIPQGTMWRREVASYGVSKALGMDHLVPVTTFRNSSDLGPGSIQEFVPDTIPASSTANRFGNSQEDLAKAAIFDFIIGNRDRHADNWLLNNDGSLVLIDNGASFPDWIGEGEYGFTDLYDAAFEKGLTIPSINPEAWPQIEESLTTSGIEPTAIFLAKERFDLATQTSGNKFDKSFRDKVWKLESDLQDELRRRNRGSAQVQDSYGRPLSYAKAPKGGVTVQGQFYPGGQFIPAEVLVNATEEERRAVESGESRGKPLPPEGGVREPRQPVIPIQTAIDRYRTTAGSRAINDHLREGFPISVQDKQVIDSLVDWIKQSPGLNRPEVVYRGLGLSAGTSPDVLSRVESGKGFTSTSFDKDRAIYFASRYGEDSDKYLLAFHLPAGTKGIHITEAGEKEFLLPPGMRFRFGQPSEPQGFSGYREVPVYLENS